ncbi:MAG: PxxKW family cysteine-rich protein [Desulfosarcinaceae bacterium]|nr:PxxKW family cysteine-rich protein [Desulfosarcinaceae bacterium]
MICTTIRQGDDCVFMSDAGCTFAAGCCHEVVTSCEGCERTKKYASGWYCTASPDPDRKWKSGHCNLATHVNLQQTSKRQKLNPLKASKRGGA